MTQPVDGFQNAPTLNPDAQAAQKLFDQGFFGGDFNKPKEDEDTNKRIALQFKEDALKQRENELKSLQVPDDQIASQLMPERERLEEQKRGLMLTGEIADDGTLTSDITNQTAPQQMIDPRDQMPNMAVMAGYNLQQEAMGMAGQAGAAKAMETAAAQSQLQKELEQQRERNEAATLQEQTELADKQAELASEVDRVSNLKVDPSKFWADRSTEQKIVLGASLFLGAFGAARTGVNRAAATINTAIDKDIAAQKSNIMQQTRGVEQQRGIYHEMKNRFRDDRLAREASRITYLNDAQLKIQALGNKYDSQIVKAKSAQLIGQLEVQKQTAQAAFMQQYQKARPVTPDANAANLNEEQRKRFVPGYGLALTSAAADKARELASTKTSINENINSLIAISNKAGSTISPTDRAKADTIANILIGQLRLPIVGPGAVSEKELELLQKIIANPTNIMSLDQTNKQRLKTLKERMTNQTNNQLRTFGLDIPEDKFRFKPLK